MFQKLEKEHSPRSKAFRVEFLKHYLPVLPVHHSYWLEEQVKVHKNLTVSCNQAELGLELQLEGVVEQVVVVDKSVVVPVLRRIHVALH